jgi:hypothetical protein
MIGLEVRIVIIVPFGSGRPFETVFHISLSSDLLYTRDSASLTECASKALEEADTIIFWGLPESTACPKRYLCRKPSAGLIQVSP